MLAHNEAVGRPERLGAIPTTDVTAVLRPLTERLLAYLPGPRPVWIAVWAIVPWLNAGANLLVESDLRSAIWDQSRALVLLNYAALSLAVAIALWGTRRVARRLETIPETTWSSLAGDRPHEAFREL